MSDDPAQNSAKLIRLHQISQIGTEMAFPAGLGFVLDYWVFGTLPWLTIIGAILGPVLAFWHLWTIVKSLPEDEKKK